MFCNSLHLSRQPPRIGRFAEPRFRHPFAIAVIKQDAIFLAGPHRVTFKEPGPLSLEKQAAGQAAPHNHGLQEGRLGGIEPIGFAQFEKHMFFQFL